MTDLKIFKNEKFGEIRIALVNGEPWFIGKDVAEALGYEKSRNAIANHVDEEDKVQKTKADLEEMFKSPETRRLEFSNYGAVLINESGFYSLVLSSKLPTARAFKKWVTSEVLPSLRKTGSYNMKQNLPSYQIENPVERAKKWIEEYNQHEAEKQVLRIENKTLKEENKELKEDNQVKGDDIDNLVDTVTQLRAGLYGSKVGNVNTGILKMANNDIEMTELYYHPNYMTTGSMGQAKPGLLYTNGFLKCLANHLNWKLYAIPDYRHNRRSIIYPRAIFNLASTYQEKYFDEITQGTGTYQITGQDLANFILEKMMSNNERNKFYNTTGKDLLI